MAVSAVTLLLLFIVLEIAVRLFVGEEVFSFRPVFRAHPVVGFTLKPNHTEYAFGAMVHSNSLGYRGPEWSVDKPAGTFRIALIGDSHAFGFGVSFEHSVGEALARHLNERGGPRCEVLNFALPGYNARQELAVFEQFALGYDPDLVLVVMCDNDGWDDFWVDRAGWLRWGEPSAVPEKGTKIEGLWLLNPWRWGLLRESRLLTWIKIAAARWDIHEKAGLRVGKSGEWMKPMPPGPIPDALRETVYRPFARLVEGCRERGVPVVMAAHAAHPDYRRLLSVLGADTGVPTIELLSVFPDTTGLEDLMDKYSLRWDPHLDVAGHRRWAEVLEALCAQHGYLPE